MSCSFNDGTYHIPARNYDELNKLISIFVFYVYVVRVVALKNTLSDEEAV